MAIRLCGAALALALCGPAVAFDVPGRQGHVVDRAGVIAEPTRGWLERSLAELAASRGVEVAVLTVPTLGGEAPEAAAQQVFDAWKMGRRGDDRGLLFLVATQDRKVRIQPGYGLEGDLPDGKLGAILDAHVLPRFREGDWTGGIVEGLRAALAPLGLSLGRGEPAPRAPPGFEELAGIALLVLLLAGAAVSPSLRFALLHAMLRGAARGGGNGGFGGGSSGGGGASRGW